MAARADEAGDNAGASLTVRQWRDVGVTVEEVPDAYNVHTTATAAPTSPVQHQYHTHRRASLDSPVLLRAGARGSPVQIRTKIGGDNADGSPNGGVEARRKSLSEVLEERRRGSGNIAQDSDLHTALQQLTQTRGRKRWADLTPRQRWRSVKDMVMAVLFLKRRYP